MTNEERDELLIRMDERLAVINEKLATDYRHIHGNGHPGLLARVQALEDQHKGESKHLGAVAVVVGFLITSAIAIYGAIKN